MLEKYQPQKVFHYFEQICQIPHPSYHCEAISNYLMNFAKEHGLEAYQDQFYNVIIIKEASAGKEELEPIMIQGHMDMVTVKDDGVRIDMQKEGLQLAVDGDYIYAKGTSLGGDDGIAIAYGLALLDDDTLSLPRIELVVTTEEEVGMEGATGIDLSVCKANRMLNLDSEDEGEFVVACAGGMRVHADMEAGEKLPMTENELLYCIEVGGLTGGHSGTEIIRHSANASKVLGSVLQGLWTMDCPFMLMDLEGGTKDNAIPIYAKALIAVSKEKKEQINANIDKLYEEFRKQYGVTDPDGYVKCCEVASANWNDMQSGLQNIVQNDAGNTMQNTERDDAGNTMQNIVQNDAGNAIQNTVRNDAANTMKNTMQSGAKNNTQNIKKELQIFSKERTRQIIDFLCEVPNGVQSMCVEMSELPQTSLNLGIMKGEADGIHFDFSLRSSVSAEKKELCDKVCKIIDKYAGTYELGGDYPAWEYKADSVLREHLVSVYEKQYGKLPEVLSIHAGLECGILASKKPGLDCVSVGPDILDIHTTRERLSISSVQRVWKFLVEALETL